jgi:hypothetical protein
MAKKPLKRAAPKPRPRSSTKAKKKGDGLVRERSPRELTLEAAVALLQNDPKFIIATEYSSITARAMAGHASRFGIASFPLAPAQRRRDMRPFTAWMKRVEDKTTRALFLDHVTRDYRESRDLNPQMVISGVGRGFALLRNARK